MINEEKLRLMTKAALLEKNSAKQFAVNRYFKKDYISSHVLLIWLCVTLAYLMVAGGAAVLYIEEYPEKAQQMDLGTVVFTVLMIYVMIVLVYAIIAMLIYARRYDRAQAVLRKYSAAMKLLEKEYENEERQNAAAEAARKGGADKAVKKKNAVKRKGGNGE